MDCESEQSIARCEREIAACRNYQGERGVSVILWELDWMAERERLMESLPKPYYDEAGIAIYNSDCKVILPQLPAGSVDLVITSPPYNLGITTGGEFPARHGPNSKSAKWSGGLLAHGYGRCDDALPFPEYEVLHRGILLQLWRLLSNRGAIFYNHKPRPQADGLWLPLSLNPGLPLRQIVTWARAGGINFATTHYVPTYEWILVFAKQEFRLRDKGASGVGDVWYIPQESDSEHPAPFPEALPARAIETTLSGTVCDPFCGQGATLRAAKKAGRKAIGIEIEEKYCEIAANRLRQAVFTFEEPAHEPATGTLFAAVEA